MHFILWLFILSYIKKHLFKSDGLNLKELLAGKEGIPLNAAKVYFIYGSQDYLLEEEIKKIINKVKSNYGAETETIILNNPDLNHHELAQNLEFNPLFVSNRIVVVKNPLWLTNDYKKVKNLKYIEQILRDYLEICPVEQTLILSSKEYSAANPVIKVIGEKCEVRGLKELSKPQMESWVKEQLANRKMKLSNSIMKKIATCGQDMNYIMNFIERLSLLPAEELTRIDIESQLDYKQEIKIFKLINAVLDRNLPLALESFHSLLQQGEAVLFILYMLGRQITVFARVKALQEDGLGLAEIEKVTNQKSFTVKNMAEKSANFTWQQINRLLNNMLQADIQLKTSSKDPIISMETLLVKILSN